MAKDALKQYRQRRELKKNSPHEPYGSVKKRSSKEKLFVVQMHDASHLHYDFRLEMDGVLKSWAVPKGVPAKTGIRHLAIPTDDHPMEYARFEGTIPTGNYGAGTVMVWDIGTYGIIYQEKNKIEVFLKGKKLWGPYVLFKTSGLYAKNAWIMMRMKPNAEFAEFGKIKGAKVSKNVSALSGRTMKQIAKDHDAEWE